MRTNEQIFLYYFLQLLYMIDIQKFIKVKKITQVEFSEKTGINRSQLNRIIKNKAELSQDHIDKIFSIYPESKDYLQNSSEAVDYLQQVIDQQTALIENLTIMVKTNANQSDIILTQARTIESLTKVKPYKEFEDKLILVAEP